MRLLAEMNKDVEAKRAAEELEIQRGLGKELSFEDYLKKDKDFNKAMEDRKERPQPTYTPASGYGSGLK